MGNWASIFLLGRGLSEPHTAAWNLLPAPRSLVALVNLHQDLPTWLSATPCPSISVLLASDVVQRSHGIQPEQTIQKRILSSYRSLLIELNLEMPVAAFAMTGEELAFSVADKIILFILGHQHTNLFNTFCSWKILNIRYLSYIDLATLSQICTLVFLNRTAPWWSSG